jgi:hypothetical protein
MRARLTALLPVAVAALLIAFCLTGAPLYSSSSGSAAVGTQLDETQRRRGPRDRAHSALRPTFQNV